MNIRNSFLMKKYIAENPKCEFCGDHAEEVHHLKPVTVGGTNEDENLISLCEHCHKIIHQKITPISELIKIGREHKRELRNNIPEIQELEETKKELKITKDKYMKKLKEEQELLKELTELKMQHIHDITENTKESTRQHIEHRHEIIELWRTINAYSEAILKKAYITIICRPRIFRNDNFILSTLLKEWINVSEVMGVKPYSENEQKQLQDRLDLVKEERS